MTTTVKEPKKTRRGPRPNRVRLKPNASLLLHKRLWNDLVYYGDGSAVRGLERAVAETCERVEHGKRNGAVDEDALLAAQQIAPDAKLVHVVLPPAPKEPMIRDGVGRPEYRYAREPHTLTLYKETQAQIVLFGDGSFTDGVKRLAHFVGVADRGE